MSIESVMPSSHLILCCPLLLLPSIFPSSRVFSNESALRIRWPKYWSFSGKESTCQCRRRGFDFWVKKIPWRRNVNPLQYSCLRNLMDRRAWQAQSRVRHDLETKQQLLQLYFIPLTKVTILHAFM